MVDSTTPAVALTPAQGAVDVQSAVSVFGLRVNDAGDFHLRIDGSAPLAATLVDEDGVTVSALEDGEGAQPLEFDVTLAPGAYALHVRAAQKDAAATIHVAVTPIG